MSFWIFKKRKDKKYWYVIDPEFFIFLLVISVLAALVVPKLFPKIGEGKHSAAKAQIVLIEEALEQFKNDTGRYPTSSEGLNALVINPVVKGWDGPYLKKTVYDPWDRPFLYKSPGEHRKYDVYSYGADGLPGGEGANRDITNWE
jgi:general secretion pathway protein G